MTTSLSTPTPPPAASPLAALAQQVDHFCAAPTLTAAPVALPDVTYQTSDYDQFHLLPENRVVDRQHVRKLVVMIGENNLLRERPLVVTADLGIIDGQHRLEAARELGLPVYYKIGQQLSEADITTLNVAQKNWGGTDYLHYWKVKGNPAYQALTAFMQRHPTLSFSNAKMMLGGSSNNRAEEFRTGRWRAGEPDKAEQVAELVERIAKETPFKHSAHTGFVAALYYCVANVEGFDPKELMRKILGNPRALVPCASHKQWLEMLSDIYNYRTNGENRVRFE